MSKTTYRVIVISTAVVLLLIGTYIGTSIGHSSVKELEPIDKVDVIAKPVLSNQNEKDIEVTYEDYYITCKHTITNKNMVFGSNIEKIIQDTDKKYKVISKDESNIVFRCEINSNCPNHFELKLVNDYVVIYNTISEGVSTIYKNTQISKIRIREEILQELVKGIKVDSIEGLNSILEDIES